MSRLMKDELFDAQLLRALGYAPYGGADVAECLAVADRISRVDASLWFDQWWALAERLDVQAEADAEAHRDGSARAGWFRASNYYRTAGLFLLQAPVDERLRRSHEREVSAFRRGAALLDLPPEVVEIPSSDGPLPGYFFESGADARRRKTLVLVNGYDGTAEELYFTNGAAALARGYNVLAFDGPGQGSMMLDRGVPFRPDWEAVVTPVIDWLVDRPEVDERQIALMGLSFGGYLAPRAATEEHRIAACISDCGPYDLFDASISRLPTVLAHQLPAGNAAALRILRGVLESVMRRPTAGWALRRNLLVHGVDDPLDFFRLAPQYTLKDRARDVTCPMFVNNTDSDDLSAAAPTLVDELTCPTTYVQFTAADGAGAHCESGARTLFHRIALDWLDATLDAVPSPPR